MTTPFRAGDQNIVSLQEARLRKEDDVRPVPISQKIAERENQKLIEYREQVDRGNRVALPDRFDGLGADPELPPLGAEDVQLIGLDLTEARSDLFMAAKVADRTSSRDLHVWLMRIVAEIDSKVSELATRGDAG